MEIRARRALDELKNAEARRHDVKGAQPLIEDERMVQLHAQRAMIFVAGCPGQVMPLVGR